MFLAFVVVISACTKATRKAPNGFEVQVVREGEGEFAAPGQFVVMNMTYKDTDDSVWFDTKKLERPGVVMVPDTSVMKNELGMENIFRALKKGDSITFKVNMKSLFEETWKTQVPPGIKPEGEMIFNIGVSEILDRNGINQLQERIQAKEYEKARKMQADQLAIDTVAIDNYLASKGITAMKTPEGLRYVITKQGTGPSPTVSNTIIATYRGMLLDGTEFEKGPLEYPLARLVQGWQIGFQKLQRGSKATLYIPSGLAYGPTGSPPAIPANANLIFEIELIDFK